MVEPGRAPVPIGPPTLVSCAQWTVNMERQGFSIAKSGAVCYAAADNQNISGLL